MGYANIRQRHGAWGNAQGLMARAWQVGLEEDRLRRRAIRRSAAHWLYDRLGTDQHLLFAKQVKTFYMQGQAVKLSHQNG